MVMPRERQVFIGIILGMCTMFYILPGTILHDYQKPSLGKLRWSVDFGKPVALRIDADVHYQPDTEEGKDEFGLLLPSGQHLVRLISKPDEVEVYTVMLFHQLRCLDIIREDYASPDNSGSPSPLSRHCLNYLRESILCHPDLRLESVRRSEGQKPTTTREYDAVCRDWTSVYDEAEKNYLEYSEQIRFVDSERYGARSR